MDKEKVAIDRLKSAAMMSEKVYKAPLVITYSGGKDSTVLLDLALKAGIPLEVNHSHTTVDAPETVYFIREKFKKLEEMGVTANIFMPKYKGAHTNMWKLIVDKGTPPTRMMRYCCEVLKEHGGTNRFIATGVRYAESVKRKNTRGIYETFNSKAEGRIILANDNDEKRLLFENCALKAKRVVNPIIDWKDVDIWDYINSYKLEINPLYGCGFNRIGCIGCPMAITKQRYKEFSMWPKYKDAYIMAFDRMLKKRVADGKQDKTKTWGNTAIDVFH